MTNPTPEGEAVMSLLRSCPPIVGFSQNLQKTASSGWWNKAATSLATLIEGGWPTARNEDRLFSVEEQFWTDPKMRVCLEQGPERTPAIEFTVCEAGRVTTHDFLLSFLERLGLLSKELGQWEEWQAMCTVRGEREVRYREEPVLIGRPLALSQASKELPFAVSISPPDIVLSVGLTSGAVSPVPTPEHVSYRCGGVESVSLPQSVDGNDSPTRAWARLKEEYLVVEASSQVVIEAPLLGEFGSAFTKFTPCHMYDQGNLVGSFHWRNLILPKALFIVVPERREGADVPVEAPPLKTSSLDFSTAPPPIIDVRNDRQSGVSLDARPLRSLSNPLKAAYHLQGFIAAPPEGRGTGTGSLPLCFVRHSLNCEGGGETQFHCNFIPETADEETRALEGEIFAFRQLHEIWRDYHPNILLYVMED